MNKIFLTHLPFNGIVKEIYQYPSCEAQIIGEGMARYLNPQGESLYGTPQPIVNQFPTPIPARRDPTTSDTGYIIGQVWVNKVAGTVWALASNSGGVASWLSLGGSLTPTVATITATTFITATAGTSTSLNGNTWAGIGTNANINLVMTPKGTGNIVVSSGNVSLTNGNVVVNTAGTGVEIKEGANGRMGTSTLVAGTKSISIASVDASTRVFLSRSGLNASPALGFLIANTSVPGTLTVSSYDATGVAVATDVSQFNYLCVEAL
jgi:hypothetical protein